jgi:hypothetical protein
MRHLSNICITDAENIYIADADFGSAADWIAFDETMRFNVHV